VESQARQPQTDGFKKKCHESVINTRKGRQKYFVKATRVSRPPKQNANLAKNRRKRNERSFGRLGA
jgi:hypothetical protein